MDNSRHRTLASRRVFSCVLLLLLLSWRLFHTPTRRAAGGWVANDSQRQGPLRGGEEADGGGDPGRYQRGD